MTEKQIKMLETSYPPLKITKETKENVKKHPELYSECTVRIQMGKFYTQEEYDKRVEDVLNRPLPGDNSKKLTNRFNKKTKFF